MPRTCFGVVIVFAAATVALGAVSLFGVLVIPNIVLRTFSCATTAVLVVGQLVGFIPGHSSR